MASDTVSIGCRLPHGVVLAVVTNSGDRRTVTLNGANKALLIGGCGITDVPRDFWNEWKRRNKDSVMLSKGTVFATGSASETAQEAKTREGDKTGFEQADPASVDRQLSALER